MTLAEFLKSKGYEIGNYGSVPHDCGLPYGTRIKPSFSPIDGGHVLVVTGETVTSCVCRCPYYFNDWSQRKTRSYDSPEELEKIIEEMMNPPKGCWT
jgi:hypothetical protein